MDLFYVVKLKPTGEVIATMLYDQEQVTTYVGYSWILFKLNKPYTNKPEKYWEDFVYVEKIDGDRNRISLEVEQDIISRAKESLQEHLNKMITKYEKGIESANRSIEYIKTTYLSVLDLSIENDKTLKEYGYNWLRESGGDRTE